jgi:hypothetical protein
VRPDSNVWIKVDEVKFNLKSLRHITAHYPLSFCCLWFLIGFLHLISMYTSERKEGT